MNNSFSPYNDFQTPTNMMQGHNSFPSERYPDDNNVPNYEMTTPFASAASFPPFPKLPDMDLIMSRPLGLGSQLNMERSAPQMTQMRQDWSWPMNQGYETSYTNAKPEITYGYETQLQYQNTGFMHSTLPTNFGTNWSQDIKIENDGNNMQRSEGLLNSQFGEGSEFCGSASYLEIQSHIAYPTQRETQVSHSNLIDFPSMKQDWKPDFNQNTGGDFSENARGLDAEFPAKNTLKRKLSVFDDSFKMSEPLSKRIKTDFVDSIAGIEFSISTRPAEDVQNSADNYTQIEQTDKVHIKLDGHTEAKREMEVSTVEKGIMSHEGHTGDEHQSKLEKKVKDEGYIKVKGHLENRCHRKMNHHLKCDDLDNSHLEDEGHMEYEGDIEDDGDGDIDNDTEGKDHIENEGHARERKHIVDEVGHGSEVYSHYFRKGHFHPPVDDTDELEEEDESFGETSPRAQATSDKLLNKENKPSEMHMEGDEEIDDKWIKPGADSGEDGKAREMSGCKNKKSRKQQVPKRIMKESSSEESQEEIEEDAHQSEEPDMSSTLSPTHVKPEKSRKQSMPRRIMTKLNDSSTCEINFEKFSPSVESQFSPTMLNMSLSSHPFLGNNLVIPTSNFLTSPTNRFQLLPHIDFPARIAMGHNLEMMRKLMDLKFTRYRKISVLEKKRIAAYARIHGVSVAAQLFGVSKSAVSMWTRMEFKEEDDDTMKKKKHCMTGNVKFEALVKRVKHEKERKFKGLSAEDKHEVVKYAKLIGVREMSRCLGIALGTVSGWMRQFPYKVKSGQTTDSVTAASEKDNDKQKKNSLPLDLSCTLSVETNTDLETTLNESKMQTRKREQKYYGEDDESTMESKNSFEDENGEGNLPEASERTGSSFLLSRFAALNDSDDESTIVRSGNSHENKKASVASKADMLIESKSDAVNVFEKKIKTENQSKIEDYQISDYTGKYMDNTMEGRSSPCEAPGHEDEVANEVDRLIAESMHKPDVDKCFEDIKEEIQGGILENDDLFEKIFKRVVETRVDKYKSLKASEKLEVVRYAKCVGVRRIAKLMDLATGTLSGWISKYQHHLDFMPNQETAEDGEFANDTNTSMDDSQNDSEIKDISEPGAGLSNSAAKPTYPLNIDDEEKSEVTALKFLLRDKFAILQQKIEKAKSLKFKNVTHEDKIEIVNCAKFVGIRPTARVFNFPLGTLSGWISKYSKFLNFGENSEGSMRTLAVDLSMGTQGHFGNETLTLATNPSPQETIAAMQRAQMISEQVYMNVYKEMPNLFNLAFHQQNSDQEKG
ncbi:hypothetical protein CHS0354_042463 [Potamilus streckersoni]|uniref:Uncharacterized protein n=1 Tax=Potamilus streckersoni TaxID=2493646 RepID=A0AAE0S9D7_9BIVA|nr:hypothetical protein CHS0354_042463 [Potamilus streckersoni]